MNKVDEFKRDGWKVLETFGATMLIMENDNDQRMLVDKFTGEIIIRY